MAVVLAALLAVSACQTDEPAADEAAPSTDTMAADTAQLADVAMMKINLNTATEADFATIPGVGERMVGEFIEYRPYASIQQFRREIGKYVDEAQVAAYEQYVFVPVRPDESDAATLQQLPGIDQSEAEALVAGRPYGSSDAFLARLAEFATPDEVAAARQYLETP